MPLTAAEARQAKQYLLQTNPAIKSCQVVLGDHGYRLEVTYGDNVTFRDITTKGLFGINVVTKPRAKFVED